MNQEHSAPPSYDQVAQSQATSSVETRQNEKSGLPYLTSSSAMQVIPTIQQKQQQQQHAPVQTFTPQPPVEHTLEQQPHGQMYEQQPPIQYNSHHGIAGPNGSMQAPIQTVIQQQVIMQAVFGKHPIEVSCGFCHNIVMTKTELSLKGEAYILSIVLCFVGGLLCCWIPCVMDSMYQTTHTCPVCKKTIGTHNP